MTRGDLIKMGLGVFGTLVFGTACKGTDGSTPTQAPVPPPPTAPSKKESAIPTTDMFSFGDNVSESMRQEIRNGVSTTHQWFLDRKIPLAGGINVYTFNEADSVIDQYFQRAPIPPSQREQERQNLRRATTWAGFSRDIFIIAGSPGWTFASPIIGGSIVEGRVHTIAHEAFHIVQRELGAYDRPPVAWMNEGSGHYIAAVLLAEKGIYDYERIRNGHLSEAAKLREPLNQLESNQSFYTAGDSNTADEYSLAFLAVEFAVQGLQDRGIDALVDFWRKTGQGREFPVAFEQAFGKPLAQFYVDFELYRQRGFKRAA